jgi:hypothetical protein
MKMMSKIFEQFVGLSYPKLLKEIEERKYGRKLWGKLNSVYQTQYYIDSDANVDEIKADLHTQEFADEDSLSIKYDPNSRKIVNLFLDNGYKIATQENWLERQIPYKDANFDQKQTEIISVNYNNYDKFRDTLEQFFSDSDTFEFYSRVLREGLLDNEEGESLTIYLLDENNPEAVMGFLYSHKERVGQIVFAYNIEDGKRTRHKNYTDILTKLDHDSRQLGIESIFTIAAGGIENWSFLTKFGFKLEDIYLDLVRV